jgi:hypothetical protein
MSEGPDQEPEPFLSDFSFSVLTCFFLGTILSISTNYILALENKPILGNVVGFTIGAMSIGYSVWQYRRFRRLRVEGDGDPENPISD